jgi:hypothetical protein
VSQGDPAFIFSPDLSEERFNKSQELYDLYDKAWSEIRRILTVYGDLGRACGQPLRIDRVDELERLLDRVQDLYESLAPYSTVKRPRLLARQVADVRERIRQLSEPMPEAHDPLQIARAAKRVEEAKALERERRRNRYLTMYPPPESLTEVERRAWTQTVAVVFMDMEEGKDSDSEVIEALGDESGEALRTTRTSLLERLQRSELERDNWKVRAGNEGQEIVGDEMMQVVANRLAKEEHTSTDSLQSITVSVKAMETDRNIWRQKAGAGDFSSEFGGMPALDPGPTDEVVANKENSTERGPSGTSSTQPDLTVRQAAELAQLDPDAFKRVLDLMQDEARSSTCCRGRKSVALSHLIRQHCHWESSYTYKLARTHGVDLKPYRWL